MPNPRESQIIDAAARLFYKHGFHNVGMDDIGEAVGISGPAIYKHFSSKDEILATLLNDAIDEIARRTVPDDDPRVELEHLLWSQAEFAVTHRELVSVYTRDDRELQMPWRRSFRRRAARHEQMWIDLLKRSYPHVPENQIVVIAHTLIGMIHSVARWPPSVSVDKQTSETLFRMAKSALQSLEEPGPASMNDRDPMQGETGMAPSEEVEPPSTRARSTASGG